MLQAKKPITPAPATPAYRRPKTRRRVKPMEWMYCPNHIKGQLSMQIRQMQMTTLDMAKINQDHLHSLSVSSRTRRVRGIDVTDMNVNQKSHFPMVGWSIVNPA